MADTNFVDSQTTVLSSWLQDVNNLVYRLLGRAGSLPPLTTQDVRNALVVTKTIDVTQYGAAATNTAAQNLVAFKAALAAVPVGGELFVPNDPNGNYLVDTSGGLSTAITISKKMTVRFQGDVQSNTTAIQANPPYIFNVTANDVTFVGQGGSVQGNGVFDTTNSGTDATFPGLINVTGDNFTCSGLTIQNVPKVGIELQNCNKALITGCKFIGGPTTYVVGNTAYFGVRANLGSGHIISNNRFIPDTGGGVLIDGVFSLSTINLLITGNYAQALWEKLAYLFCSNSTVSNNQVNYPGGNQTDAIRIEGSSNLITGNWTVNAMGGVTVLDGNQNRVVNNSFIACKQTGVNVTQLSGTYTSGFSDTEISGNFISAGAGSTLVSGIQLNSVGGDSFRIKITGNTVLGFGPTGTGAQISLTGAAPNTVWDSIVANNSLNGNATGQYGVFCGRCSRTKIFGNHIASTVTAGVGYDAGTEGTVSDNFFFNPGVFAMNFGPASLSTAMRALNNRSLGATNNGIANLTGANSWGRGNQYTDAPLTGTLTLAAATSTTVAHGGVATNAQILIQEINASAGTMLTAKGRCYTTVNGTGFTVSVANATAAAGTEQFAYEILQ